MNIEKHLRKKLTSEVEIHIKIILHTNPVAGFYLIEFVGLNENRGSVPLTAYSPDELDTEEDIYSLMISMENIIDKDLRKIFIFGIDEFEESET